MFFFPLLLYLHFLFCYQSFRFQNVQSKHVRPLHRLTTAPDIFDLHFASSRGHLRKLKEEREREGDKNVKDGRGDNDS